MTQENFCLLDSCEDKKPDGDILPGPATVAFDPLDGNEDIGTGSTFEPATAATHEWLLNTGVGVVVMFTLVAWLVYWLKPGLTKN